MTIRAQLWQLVEARHLLSQPEAAALMRQVLAAEASELELAAALGALGARGVTAAELAGFAEVLRGAALPLNLTEAERARVVDSCGTGGDASGSFNISTAAALVAAAAGAPVAKHGNRAVTSRCGSADVLEALGIPTELSGAEAAESLRRHGFCFLLAPAHHPALRAVLPVRRALGVRTVFHLLGPMLNPAGARRQVLGVYDPRLLDPAAEALARLHTEHALVVHGAGGMDELSLSGATEVAEVREGKVRHWRVTPEELGLEQAPLSLLRGGDARENASILQSIFAGEAATPQTRAQRDVVLLNAAAVLLAAQCVADLVNGIALARKAIEAGKVQALVACLRTTAPAVVGQAQA